MQRDTIIIGTYITRQGVNEVHKFRSRSTVVDLELVVVVVVAVVVVVEGEKVGSMTGVVGLLLLEQEGEEEKGMGK